MGYKSYIKKWLNYINEITINHMVYKDKYLIVLFTLVFLFRMFFGLTHLAFSQDQIRDAMMMNVFKSNDFFFIGYGPKASVGDFYLAPLYYQISYWIYLITNSELSIFYFTVIIESLTPIVIYVGLKTMFSKKISILASLTYAFGAQITLFSVTSWNPNMIPFLSALVLTSALKLRDRSSSELWIVALLLAVTIAIHLHFQGIILVPFMLFQIFQYIYVDKRRFLPLILGVVLCIISIMPYVITEYQYNFVNTKNIFTFLTKDHPNIYDRVSKPDFIINYISFFLERMMTRFAPAHHWFAWFIWFGGIASTIKVILQQEKLRSRGLTWLLYLLTILIMLRVYKGDKLDFYLGPLFLAIAYFFAFISRLKFKLGLVISVAVVFISGQELGKIPNYNQYLETHALCQSLKQFELPISPLIQNPDLLQGVAYCRSRGVNIDRQSLLVVDFCDQKSDCINTSKIYCTNRQDNISRLFKQASLFKPLNQYRSSVMNYQSGYASRKVVDFLLTKDFGSPQLLPNNSIPAWMEQDIDANRYL